MLEGTARYPVWKDKGGAYQTNLDGKLYTLFKISRRLECTDGRQLVTVAIVTSKEMRYVKKHLEEYLMMRRL